MQNRLYLYLKLHTFSFILSASGLLALLAGCPISDPCNGIVCNDDGLFCNGVEFCENGACSSSGDPCSAGETCDEQSDACTSGPCETDADCDDGLFCNGTETCVHGSCQAYADSLADTYSTVSNPSGNWTYARTNSVTASTVDVLGVRWEAGWYLGNFGHGGPGVLDSTGTGPSLWAKDNSNGFPVIRWTAPSAGVYDVLGEFEGNDPRGVNNNVYVVVNGAIEFSDLLTSPSDIAPFSMNGLALFSGDYVDFTLTNNGGNTEFGWTRINAAITPSSTPCSATQTCDEENDSCTATPDCTTDANCDDGLFCNGAETCIDGFCQPGAAPCAAGQSCDEATDSCTTDSCNSEADCDDDDVCTDDICDMVSGECVFANNTSACDDGDNCTQNDICDAGVCAGTPMDCAEGETCVNGACVQPCLVHADCDDALFCNGTETCLDGSCQPGAALCVAGQTCDEDSLECTPSGSLPFFDDFEGGIGGWSVDNGVWQVGVPSSGPNSAVSPEYVAATVLAGNYPGTSSRLVSPSIQLAVTVGGEELHLRFWHWFAFGATRTCTPYCSYYEDNGIVQIRERTGPGQWGAWTTLTSFAGSSAVYTNALVDLSGYAGRKIQIGFLLSSGGATVLAGWYIDDVTIDVF